MGYYSSLANIRVFFPPLAFLLPFPGATDTQLLLWDSENLGSCHILATKSQISKSKLQIFSSYIMRIKIKLL